MSSLTTINKVSMFLSSYTPLFMILLLKAMSDIWYKIQDFTKIKVSDDVFANITYIDKLQIFNLNKTEFMISNFFSILVIVIISIIIIMSYINLKIIMNKTLNTENSKNLCIKSVQKMDHIYIEYMICYIIPFLSFNYSNPFDMFLLLILLSTACIIYINSDLLYVNIIFSISGYRLFKIIDENKYEYVVMSKKKQLYVEDIIEVRDVSSSSERFVLDLV